MNNNLKIFFRKLIWSGAAIYVGVVISFSGFKLAMVAYSYIEITDVSLASVYFGTSDNLSSNGEILELDNSSKVSVDIVDQMPEEKIREKETSFTFVGDIMLDHNVENSVYENGNGDFSFIFENTDFLRKSDITFGNLEGPVSDKVSDIVSVYKKKVRLNEFFQVYLEDDE